MKHLAIAALAGLMVMLGGVAAAQSSPAPVMTPDRQPETAQPLPLDTLKALSREMTPEAKASGRDLAFRTLFVNRTHGAFLIHRTATAEAEYHDGFSDYWVVVDGAGTLVYGGELVEPRELAPGEKRSARIEGGTRMAVKAGDQINIPPGMAHQILLEPGTNITYMIVKVNVGQHPWDLLR